MRNGRFIPHSPSPSLFLCSCSLVLALLSPLLAHADDDGVPRPAAPASGPTLDLRLSYEAFFFGKQAGRNVGDVFSAGPGLQVDVGWLLKPGVTVYVAYDHFFYGVGGGSPYAGLPTVQAQLDGAAIGLRYGCDSPRFGVWFAADAAIAVLHQQGADAGGGSAYVNIPGAQYRLGVGACVRPIGPLVLAPSVMLNLFDPFGSESGSVTATGQLTRTSGTVPTALLMGVSPGVSVTGEF
jgi:hypothetical protein